MPKKAIASIIPDWHFPEILSHNSMGSSWQNRWTPDDESSAGSALAGS